MKQLYKISTIAILVAVIGMITVGPAMADDDDEDERKKQKKIDICHFDKKDGEYVKISKPENKAKGHNNHEKDMIPAPAGGCPEQEESKTESDDGINMDEFMGELTRHGDVITEITNSECSPGEMVTGFGPNGELLCSLDNTGEDNSFNIISRTETVDLPSNVDLSQPYSCNAGEIIIGGLIEMPSLNAPLFNEGEIFSGSEQVFNVKVLNDSSDTVTVNVTWLCFVV